jgi:shikimate kinase
LSKSKERNIALTGFMAVGKSSVGRSLARRLRRPFIDLDSLIEKTERLKVREIFSRKGERYFRQAEKKALQKVLAEDGQVIATGGGVVLDEENLQLLRDRSFLICLSAAPGVIDRRAGEGSKRPLLERHDDRRSRIQELLQQREKNYGAAHATIDTSHLSVDQVAEKIMNLLRDSEATSWRL